MALMMHAVTVTYPAYNQWINYSFQPEYEGLYIGALYLNDTITRDPNNNLIAVDIYGDTKRVDLLPDIGLAL